MAKEHEMKRGISEGNAPWCVKVALFSVLWGDEMINKAPTETDSAEKGWRLVLHLKRTLVAGLLVVIPLGLTLFILRFLFEMADGILAPFISRGLDHFLSSRSYLPGLGMIAGLIVIYVTGLIAGNFFGRKLVGIWETLLSKIPLVKSIYISSKQLTQVLSQGGKNSFRKAVYVEFPLEGSYSLGFVTNTVPAASGKTYHTVFVPTSPNPTSGYVLFLEDHRIYPASFNVEEGMKIIMSGGMVSPDMIRAERLQ